MQVVIVPFGTPGYAEALALRARLLRTPLGLQFTEADAAADRTHIHFAAVENTHTIGVAVLVPPKPDGVAKVRQVAVDPAHRGRGLGTLLMRHAETEAARLGARTVALNARDTAAAFYRKLGYTPDGDPFIEVTIPHIRMTKPLD